MEKKLKLSAVTTACALVVGVGAAVGLSSCGNAYGGPSITISGPASQSQWLKERLDDFNATQFDSDADRINFTIVAHGEDKVDSEITNWATGPNVYAYASDKIQPLYAANALAPVPDEYVTQLEQQVGEGAMEAATFVNDIYAYPYTGDNGYFLMYNDEYVTAEQAGDIYKLVDAAKAAGKKIAYPIEEAFYGAGALFTFGAGYDIKFTATGAVSSVDATFDTDAGFKAAKAFVDLLKYAGDTIITDTGGQAAPDGETLVAVVDGSWSAASYTETVGDSLQMSKLPEITYNKGQAGEEKTTIGSFLGYKLYGVNPQANGGDPEIVKLSHDIAMYLTSEDVQENRFDELQIVPTNETVLEMDKVQASKVVKAIGDQGKYATAQTAVPGNLWSAPNTFWQNVTENYNTLTDEQIREALATLNTTVEESR